MKYYICYVYWSGMHKIHKRWTKKFLFLLLLSTYIVLYINNVYLFIYVYNIYNINETYCENLHLLCATTKTNTLQSQVYINDV